MRLEGVAPGVKRFGKVNNFNHASCLDFFQELDQIIAQPLKQGADGDHWPLVKSAQVWGPWEAPRHVAKIINCAGLGDDNAARSALAKQKLKDADLVWILTCIGRGMSDQIGMDAFKSKLQQVLMRHTVDHDITDWIYTPVVVLKRSGARCTQVAEKLMELRTDPDYGERKMDDQQQQQQLPATTTTQQPATTQRLATAIKQRPATTTTTTKTLCWVGRRL